MGGIDRPRSVRLLRFPATVKTLYLALCTRRACDRLRCIVRVKIERQSARHGASARRHDGAYRRSRAKSRPAVALFRRQRETQDDFAVEDLLKYLADQHGMSTFDPGSGEGGRGADGDVADHLTALVGLFGKRERLQAAQMGFKGGLVDSLGKHPKGTVPGAAKRDRHLFIVEAKLRCGDIVLCGGGRCSIAVEKVLPVSFRPLMHVVVVSQSARDVPRAAQPAVIATV
jgi:hypothetical protein